MGAIIDLTPRLIREAKARGAVDPPALLSLALAERQVAATRQELLRQTEILCDARASPRLVEEAASAVPLLRGLLRERMRALRLRQRQLLGPG